MQTPYAMKVHSFVFNAFEENTYLLSTEQGQGILIDPGCASEEACGKLCAFLDARQIRPVLMLLTHGHFDHFAGCAAVAEKYHPRFGFAAADQPYLDSMVRQGRAFGFEIGDLPEPDFFLEENEPVVLDDIRLQVLATPGHSRGSVCLYEASHKLLLSGDTLFRGSIGRTDLPGGDYDSLMDSIEQKLMTLPMSTRVLPGHGPSSTLDDERMENPFLLRLGK